MGSLCLSTASILRCESFTQLQVIILIIPTALEVIFSTSLVFTIWGSGRRHLWLTAEGWIYFALALVEMLSNILPAARDTVEVFKVIDTVLAATSFLPILFYIIFIFSFTRAELIDILPRRFQMISKLMLLFFIPTIIALNEVASFVGLSHRIGSIDSRRVLNIGFRSNKDQLLWTFFTSLTLALLTAYQAINFSLAFYRLIKAFLNQRRIETSSSDEAHLFKGIGWITGALKLGAIETVAGFAGGGFGGALTRRILRLLARAFLAIGLVKGLDVVVDFEQVRGELSAGNRQEFRRSRLRDFISNPRFSTFRQLTPTATAFHATPRAPAGLSQFSPRAGTEKGLAGMKQFAEVKQLSGAKNDPEKPPYQRVTINFNNGTPRLHLRFSSLEMPPPVFGVKSRPTSEWVPPSRPVSHRLSSYHADSQRPDSRLNSSVITDFGKGLQSPPRMYTPVKKSARAESSYSAKSIPESYTSLSAVRELASQFPPLPPHALETIQQSPAAPAEPSNFWDDSASIASRSSFLIDGDLPETAASSQSADNIDPFSSDDDFLSAVPVSIPLGQPVRTLRNPSAQFNQDVSVPASPTSTPMTMLSGYTRTPTGNSALTADTDDAFLDFGTALDTGKSKAFTRNSDAKAHPADWIDYDAIRPMDGLSSIAEDHIASHQTSTHTASRSEDNRSLRKSDGVDVLKIPWLKHPEMEEEERRLGAMSNKARLARIKSVGKAPMRSTPVPMKTGHVIRGSLHIEPIMIPPKQHNNMEIIQGSLDSTYSRSVLRDSEVLGIEDGSYAQDLKLKKRGYF